MGEVVAMPRLEVLEVKSQLSIPPTPIVCSLTLDHLRALDLSVDAPNLDFLTHITCPAGVSLRMSIHHDFLNSDAFSSIFHVTTAFVTQGRAPLVIKTLLLYAHSPWNLSLKFWPRIILPDEITVPYSDSTCLELSFETATPIDLMGICNHLARDNLVAQLDTLSLRFGQDRWPSEPILSLASAFSPLDSIRVFIAKDWQGPHVHELLSTKLSSPSEQYIFPNLKAVVTGGGHYHPYPGVAMFCLCPKPH